MRRLFNEYAVILITLLTSFIGINIVIGLVTGSKYIDFIMKGLYGL